jgi:HipA-like C-terminal domain
LADDLEFTAHTIGDDLNRATAEAILQQIKSKAQVPRRFKRICARSSKWSIPRSFVGYRADPTIQTLGYAPKWVLKSQDGGPDYIVKMPYKGRSPEMLLTETLTELLINQLGLAYRFDMAHSGLASIDGKAVFVTRSFLRPTEHLVHGSFLMEDILGAPRGELDAVPKGREEQKFYSVGFVLETMKAYCGDDASNVIDKFVEMVLFDALVGSTDRHAQNWGVIRASTTQGGYRFSPIFDTSRGLLWNLPDDKLLPLQQDETLLRNHIDRAFPLMGPERIGPELERKTIKSRKCHHFDFLRNLFAVFPHLKVTAVTKVPYNFGRTTASIINSFPFRGAFSKLRRDTILKLLLLRADLVSQVLGEGG